MTWITEKMQINQAVQNNIRIISGYKFIPLKDLHELHDKFLSLCSDLTLKGTILLSLEGINLMLCGPIEAILQFKNELKIDDRFASIFLQEQSAEREVFRRLKIKIKPEIISFRQGRVMAPIQEQDALASSYISPQTFKQWLDEKREMVLLDARNDYEFAYGSFNNALHLNIKHFTDFPAAFRKLALNENNPAPIVTFCTGGIRCEKVALYLQQLGMQHIYQLQGGILNYFTQVGRTHYHGNCFVFDERECV